MRGPDTVLLVCTANQCRSPMAAALLRQRVHAAGMAGPAGVVVDSAGTRTHPGAPATAEALATVEGLVEHRTRSLEEGVIAAADLILGMTRDHVRDVAVRDPEALGRTFTLKEFVRRAEAAGPRRPGEDLRAYAARAGAGRRHQDLVGLADGDDVADPIGGPPGAYRETAAELAELVERLAALVWGV